MSREIYSPVHSLSGEPSDRTLRLKIIHLCFASHFNRSEYALLVISNKHGAAVQVFHSF